MTSRDCLSCVTIQRSAPTVLLLYILAHYAKQMLKSRTMIGCTAVPMFILTRSAEETRIRTDAEHSSGNFGTTTACSSQLSLSLLSLSLFTLALGLSLVLLASAHTCEDERRNTEPRRLHRGHAMYLSFSLLPSGLRVPDHAVVLTTFSCSLPACLLSRSGPPHSDG